MKKIVIIGGGFAGLWAAFSAVRAIKMYGLENKVEVLLINKDKYHGLRPRFYEYDLESTRISLEKYLHPLGINLILGEVTDINHLNQTITLHQQKTLRYDRLIVATGSHLYLPDIPGFREYAFNVDSYYAADRLKAHVDSLSQKEEAGRYTIVIAGGSFTGIEAATDLMDRLKKITPHQARVIIIDRSEIASRFSQEMREVILTALKEMEIETIANVQIKKITANQLELSSGEIIATQTVVWAAGMQANQLAEKFNLTLDRYGRLPVDRYLKIQDIHHCFAAGDIAAATTDGTHTALLSCQHAMPQGRFAGHNAVADLFEKELLIYEQPTFVTCLDLGSWGAIYSEGWDQQVVSIREAAKKIKLFINHKRIYPPSDNLNDLLEAAEPKFKPLSACM